MRLDVSKLLPSALVEYGSGWSNLIDSIQNNVNYYLERIDGLRNMYLPEKTDLYNETAYLVGAYITSEDSIRGIKDKIGNAYYTHKNISNFSRVWKLIIDKICGSDCGLYKGLINYQSFVIDVSIIDSSSLIEDLCVNNTPKPKGDIYIDLGLIPTSQQLISLRLQLEQIKPIYFNIFIGQKTILSAEEFTVDSADSMIDSYNLIETASSEIIKFNVFLIL